MELHRLHAEFGVEIRGLDVTRDLSKSDAERLREALDRYQLVVLPLDAPLAPERQVALVGLFGVPVDNGGGRLWSVLRNDEETGSMQLPFHCDLSYTDAPVEIISLYAEELPPGGTTTSFVSNAANWAALPAELQAQLAPLQLRHRYASTLAFDWPEFIADHPLCRIHPRTGQPLLFVTEHHADRILEMEAAESTAMLNRLFAHSYADSRVYTHHWRPHDLLIWDNLATQHARREVAHPTAGPRTVRRVVTGDLPFPELIERARQQQARRAAAVA